jgi:hypothetical protein
VDRGGQLVRAHGPVVGRRGHHHLGHPAGQRRRDAGRILVARHRQHQHAPRPRQVAHRGGQGARRLRVVGAVDHDGGRRGHDLHAPGQPAAGQPASPHVVAERAPELRLEMIDHGQGTGGVGPLVRAGQSERLGHRRDRRRLHDRQRGHTGALGLVTEQRHRLRLA